MRRSFNRLTDEQLIRIAQKGVEEELKRKISEGKPVSYYDKEKKQVYRLSPNGERIYVQTEINHSD